MHGQQLEEVVQPLRQRGRIVSSMWDLYKEALSVQERKSVPAAGNSVDRRTFEYTSHVYTEGRIRSLICFACARIHVDTGRIRSAIEFVSGRWLFSLPRGSLTKNFSLTVSGAVAVQALR